MGKYLKGQQKQSTRLHYIKGILWPFEEIVLGQTNNLSNVLNASGYPFKYPIIYKKKIRGKKKKITWINLKFSTESNFVKTIYHSLISSQIPGAQQIPGAACKMLVLKWIQTNKLSLFIYKKKTNNKIKLMKKEILR